MARYEEDEVKVLSTQDLKYLHHCDQKLNGVLSRVTTSKKVLAETNASGFRGYTYTQEQADREFERLTAARKDIMKRLSKEDKAEYKEWQKANAPKEMTEDERAAMLKRLAENKDKPSH